MDIQLIGPMNGIEAAEKIRAIADIPIVYLTAHTDDLLLKQAQLTEPYGYIVKPAHRRELNATIEMALYKHALDRKLKESEGKFRSITERISDLIIMLDPEGYPTYVSPSITSILGFPQESYIGKRAGPDIIQSDDIAKISQAMERLKNGSPEEAAEFRMLKNDGSYAIFDGRGTPIIANGIYAGVQVVAREITERKRAEEAFRKSEGKYRTLVETTGTGFVIIDDQGRVLDANPEYLRLTGHASIKDITGRNVIEWTAAYEKDKNAEAVSRCMKDGYIRNLEIDYVNASGTIIPIEINATVLRSGDAVQILTLCRDITERKRAEEKLRQSETRFRTIIHSMQFGIVVIDANTHTILDANDKALEMIGGSNESVSGSVCHRFICPAELGKCPVTDLGQTVDSSERILLTMRGERVPILKSVVRTTLGGKEVLIESFIDITERKRAEEELLESRQRFQGLVETLYDWIWEVDDQGRYTYVSPQIKDILGYEPEELLGKTPFDIMPAEEAQRVSKIFGLFLADQSSFVAVENIILHKDGHPVIMETYGLPFYDTNGNFKGYRGTDHDITERKELEKEKEYHTQKLQKISDSLTAANKKLNLLSSITRHDITNQLTVLVGYLRILEKEQPDTSFSEHFKKINTSAQRISAMLRFTKEYDKIGVHAPVWQDTRTLVDSAAKQAPLGKIVVKNDLSAGAEVFADPLVVKVFYNLMDNAVRYGGKITTIRIFAEESADEHLIVCEDDGDGVVAGDKEKIFERGFGKNTGLGLALSREIFDITGITIRENGEPGKGARFEMMVPKGAWRLTDVK